MRYKNLEKFFILSFILFLGLLLKIPFSDAAYPGPFTCDATGCHLEVRNDLDDNSLGTLREALAQACSRGGDHLISFGNAVPSPSARIRLQAPLDIPSDCRANSINIAGRGTPNVPGSSPIEINIDGSALRSNNTLIPDGSSNQCSFSVNSNTTNVFIHNLTFTGAPFALCAFGNNVTMVDNYIGSFWQDGAVGVNQNGIYLGGNGSACTMRDNTTAAAIPSPCVHHNVIASNSGNGILIAGQQYRIENNYLGVLPRDVNVNRGNGGAGIRLLGDASQNVIGGVSNSQANIIRYNSGGGIVLAGTANSTRNNISHNIISRNLGLGIDLGSNGVSLPPVPLMQGQPFPRPAAGPNATQPLAADAHTIPQCNLDSQGRCTGPLPPSAWTFRARAQMNSLGNYPTEYEIYLVDAQDPSDPSPAARDSMGNFYGEGDTLLISGRVLRDANDRFRVSLNNPLLAIGRRVSAILRDAQGNTSEFSAAIELLDRENPPLTPLCGNGVITGTETCDDGNTTAGDGCSSTCMEETGWDCVGSPSLCLPICGDGIRIPITEACDDGNQLSGDGCSSICRVEDGYMCVELPNTPSRCETVCGDGFRTPLTEACDDGNPLPGDGCSGCRVDPGFTCFELFPNFPSACMRTCGNRRIDFGETCDDGNILSNDGCSALCAAEPGWICIDLLRRPIPCTAIRCGDGFRAGREQCDDGNTLNGDGCSSTCTSELPPRCGDNIIQTLRGENCDDGNTMSNDGCSALCATEPGWICVDAMGNPIPCAAIRCGDNIRAGAEQCDDGNTNNGDGCSSMCMTEAPGVCGDGMIQSIRGESCDDGNTANNDGCSGMCRTEPGWICVDAMGNPVPCTPSCGDGLRRGMEACDDGNTANNDGCSSMCLIEPPYICTEPNLNSPSICTLCRNGQRDIPPEQCDATAPRIGPLTGTDPACCQTNCTFAPVRSPTAPCSDNDSTTRDDHCDGSGNCIGTPNLCGDGMRLGMEACDDGGVLDGDGCSAACTVEPGYTCMGMTPDICRSVCGDGVKASNEGCDDGNNFTGDGCSAACVVESGWICTEMPPTAPSLCHQACGDSLFQSGAPYFEQCDRTATRPLPLPFDPQCCSMSCRITPGTTCSDGHAYTSGDTCDAMGMCTGVFDNCGNSILESAFGETCDDANRISGDGCSSACTLEPGYNCTGMPSVCTPSCGDGMIAPGIEECDDSNTLAGDGCSTTCTIENDWVCVGSPSVCSRTCGNGTVDTAVGEQCEGSTCCLHCRYAPLGTVCDDGSLTTTADQCNTVGVCSGTPIPPPGINPPINLTGSADGPNRVRIGFTDDSSNETGFYLERADGPCETATTFTRQTTLSLASGTGSRLTATDLNVQAGATYCYQAIAFNTTLTSVPSNRATVTTPNPAGGVPPPAASIGTLEGSGFNCALSGTGSVSNVLWMMMGLVPILFVRLRRKN